MLAALVLCVTAMLTGPVLAQSQQLHRNSIAVVIGNQRYQHTTPVQYAQNDARAIEKYLIERLGFRKGNILLRMDVGREQMETIFGEPDRADGELMDRLLDRRPENRGDVFVFYSGHGVPDPDAAQDDSRRAFLLPVDVSQARIGQAAFPIERLYKKLDLVRGHLPTDRKVIMMLDACFSGRTPVARGQGEGPDASIFRFSRGSFSVRADEPAAGLVRLIAATGDQVAYWDEPRKLGLFTSLFLRAVAGEADGQEFGNGDKIVSGDELGRFLEERVPAEARLRHQRTQRPTLEGLDRFAWTIPRAGQIAAPPAIVPVPVRVQPAALPAPAVTPAPVVAPVAPPTIASPAPAPVNPITAPVAPSAALPAPATAPVVAPVAPVAPPSVASPTPTPVNPTAAPVARPPVAPAPAAKPQQAAVPAAAPPVVAPRPPVVPAPKPPRAAEPEKAKPAPPPKRTARAAPRPVVEDDDEPVRPRARPRPRPAAEPQPRPRPAPRVVQPREPSGGGCRVVNGVRFCG